MKRNKGFVKKLFFIFSALFLVSNLYAEKITFSAEQMSGQAGNKQSSTILTGSAFIQTESMEIMADTIELSGDNYRRIKAQGNVSGKNLNSNMEFKCSSIEYDRETNVAMLRGDVSLEDTANELNASAQIIEYNQSTDVAVLQIQVQLIQKNNVCSGAYAVYQKNNQLLDISGNATVKQGDDVFRAQQITLNLKTQDIKLTGNVKGSVTETSKAPADSESDSKKQPESEKKTESSETANPAEKTSEPDTKSGEKNDR